MHPGRRGWETSPVQDLDGQEKGNPSALQTFIVFHPTSPVQDLDGQEKERS